jgi:hypothetical protein
MHVGSCWNPQQLAVLLLCNVCVPSVAIFAALIAFKPRLYRPFQVYGQACKSDGIAACVFLALTNGGNKPHLGGLG